MSEQIPEDEMARQWFTSLNTEGLCGDDLRVMNRAVRHLVGDGSPSHRLLMDVRMTYRPGMSAADVMDALEERQS